MPWDSRAAAAELVADVSNVDIIGADRDDSTGRFDAITMIAVLPHLDLSAAPARIERLRAPGGRSGEPSNWDGTSRRRWPIR